MSPAAWADPAAATEVDLAWQDAKYNVDPPATVKTGTLLNAVAHLNRNFGEVAPDDDVKQEAGIRTFTFVATNGSVTSMPAFCLEGSALTPDRVTLTCKYNADATHGVATEFVIPVTARGKLGDKVHATITDDAGLTAETTKIPVTANDGINVIVTSQQYKRLVEYSYGMMWAMQIQNSPSALPPSGPVEFDLTVDWSGTGKAPTLIDPANISIVNGDVSDVTYDKGEGRGINVAKDLNGAQWKVTNTSGNGTTWTYHVKVENIGDPDPTGTRYSNGTDAGGWRNLSGVRVVVGFKDGVTTEQTKSWGQGGVRLSLSNVSYTSGVTNTVLSDQPHANFRTDDDVTTGTYLQPGSRNYQIVPHEWSFGDYATNVNAKTLLGYTTSANNGSARTNPGGVVITRNALTGHIVPANFCTVLPKGQGAHFSGEWWVSHQIMPNSPLLTDPRSAGDNYVAMWQGIPGHQFKANSGYFTKALLAVPKQGATRGKIQYYTGATSLPFGSDCSGDEGWVDIKPDDMSTVSGIRLLNYDVARLPGDTADVATVMFVTVIRADDDAPVGSHIWTSGASSLPATAPMTALTKPTSPVLTPFPADQTPAGWGGTTTGTDHFTIIGPKARNIISIAQENQTPVVDDTIPVDIMWGAFAPSGEERQYTGLLTATLPKGATYVPGSFSALLGEPTVTTDAQGRQVLTWKDKTTDGGEIEKGSFAITVAGSAGTYEPFSSYTLDPKYGDGSAQATTDLKAGSKTKYSLSQVGHTILTVDAPSTFGVEKLTGDVAWTLKTQNDDGNTQGYVSTLSVLPYNGDGRGTAFGGALKCVSVMPAEGAEVWINTADPASIKRSPLDGSNGAVHAPGAGWTKLDGTTDLPADTTAVWFINKNVASGAVLEHKVNCTYKANDLATAQGQKFTLSAISAATSTKLKTIEIADSTTSAEPSPVRVDKVWEPADTPVGGDGLLHFTGTATVIDEGNGVTNLVVTDDGGAGLKDVKLTKVMEGDTDLSTTIVAGTASFKIPGFVKNGRTFTFEGTAALATTDGPLDVVNKVRVASDEHPKGETPDEQCQINEGVDADTDQCDLVRHHFDPKFAVNKTAEAKSLTLKPGQSELSVEYTVTTSSLDKIVGGTTAAVIDTPREVTGLKITSATVDGKAVVVDAGSFEVTAGDKLAPAGVDGAQKVHRVVVTYAVTPAELTAQTWESLTKCDPAPGPEGSANGLTNKVQMNGDADDEGSVNNNTCIPFEQPEPLIKLVKSINGEDANQAPGVAVAAGEPMRVSFRVSNTGVVPLGKVVVTDSVITDAKAITCPKDTLAAGEEMTCTASLPAPVVGVQHENTATASGTDPYGVVVRDDDPAHAAVAGFAVSKTAVDSGVRVNGTAGERVSAGFVVTVENTGLVEGVSSDVVDRPSVPAGMKLVSVRVDGKPVTGALDSFVVIPSSSVPAGKKIQARVEVTYQVEAALSQAQWDVLSQCQTGQDGNKGYGLFNVVSSDQDTTGSGDNDACVPLTPPGAGSLAYTGASLTGLGLLALVTALGGIGLVVARRRA